MTTYANWATDVIMNEISHLTHEYRFQPSPPAPLPQGEG